MNRIGKKVDVEKVVKTLMVPLTDVNVLVAMRSAMAHFELALTRASREGPEDEQAASEAKATLRQLVVVAHAITGALLADMEPSTGGSGPLQEVQVAKAATGKRSRKPRKPSGVS
jgi:hypothetical protein